MTRAMQLAALPVITRVVLEEFRYTPTKSERLKRKLSVPLVQAIYTPTRKREVVYVRTIAFLLAVEAGVKSETAAGHFHRSLNTMNKILRGFRAQLNIYPDLQDQVNHIRERVNLAIQ